MRAPSDAQARLLKVVVAEADGGHVLMWRQEPIGASACLCIEHVDRDANTSTLVYKHHRTREASVAASVRHGWLDATHEQTRGSDRFCELRLTDDGDLALHLWEHRKLHAPPAPLPTLLPEDREALRVAEAAARLGYALVPSYVTHDRRERARMEACRLQMRRLVRDGWAIRAYVGGGQTAVAPTAVGVAEVADDLDAPRGGHADA